MPNLSNAELDQALENLKQLKKSYRKRDRDRKATKIAFNILGPVKAQKPSSIDKVMGIIKGMKKKAASERTVRSDVRLASLRLEKLVEARRKAHQEKMAKARQALIDEAREVTDASLHSKAIELAAAEKPESHKPLRSIEVD